MRLSLPGILLVVVGLLFVVPSAVGYYTDWLWFRELGYDSVFIRSINAQFTVFVATFLAVFLFIYLNIRLAGRAFNRPHVVLGRGVDGQQISVDRRRLTRMALWISLMVGLALGLAGANDWLTWLSAFHAVPFGDRDPLFGRDVAFYVFTFPVLQIVRQQAMITTVLTLIGCGLYYVFSGSFVIESRYGVALWPRVRLVPAARRHLGILVAVVFILMAWGAWLELPRTLLSAAPATATVAFGASYTDVHAGFPFLRATLVILVAGAGLSLWYGFSRLGWPLALAVGLYLTVSVAGGIYAALLQSLIVTPNEQDREQQFIIHNIAATRRAYALDRVEERELMGDATLTPQDIVSNAGTIENVRLWDHQPLLQTFAQIQEIRTYYDFINVDNDRYTIDGKYRQMMLSARELNPESIQNRSWVNERLFFTHGYGLTLGPVNQVTTQGLPVLYIRDLPPVSTVNLRVDQPSIYFGELSNSYVLVRTRQPEFHYPRGDDNETTYYEGTGGVPIGNFLRRLMFAIKFANSEILVTGQLTPESRIMFHRRIADRVRVLAPFLSFDSDPYPVVSNGQVFWIQDAYTSTANYPYATPATCPAGVCNYIRNSVKIVIDAFNGTTTMYLAEPDDPLALTISKIFPGMLRPLSGMPADLRQHVRYPEDIFDIQSKVFATYHMTNPLVFYNKEDQWQVPVLESERNATPMRPYYTVMRLPGEKRTEFIQMLPFTPRLKDNLSAWMVARSDGGQYGRLVVFQFPKQKIVYGPKQIAGLISQDQVISQLVTLWNQQGSQVIWGTLLVIPLNESLIYVRPLYLRSSEGRIPELKRVVVAYQSRIVMAETMNQALSQIFGPAVAAGLSPDRLESSATSVIKTTPEPAAAPGVTDVPPPSVEPTFAELVDEAIAHRDRAEKALRDGNLGLYAEEMKKVGELLDKMKTVKK
jgi:uncharacterized membrane protein (UPF0182 family)